MTRNVVPAAELAALDALLQDDTFADHILKYTTAKDKTNFEAAVKKALGDRGINLTQQQLDDIYTVATN